MEGNYLVLLRKVYCIALRLRNVFLLKAAQLSIIKMKYHELTGNVEFACTCFPR